MNKIISQIRTSSLISFAILTVIGFMITPSANAGFMDWLVQHNEETNIKKSFAFALSYFDDSNGDIKKDSEVIPEQKPEVKKEAKILKTYKVTVTAYTSDPRQTDATPCIPASGLDLCVHGQENVIAANFLKLKTKVMIPELFGDKVFTVEDRMNKRFDFENSGEYRIDIWFKDNDIQRAREFGLKRNRTMHIVLIDA